MNNDDLKEQQPQFRTSKAIISLLEANLEKRRDHFFT